MVNSLNFGANIELTQWALSRLASQTENNLPVDVVKEVVEKLYPKQSSKLIGLLKVEANDDGFLFKAECLNAKEYPAGETSMQLVFLDLKDFITRKSIEFFEHEGWIKQQPTSKSKNKYQISKNTKTRRGK